MEGNKAACTVGTIAIPTVFTKDLPSAVRGRCWDVTFWNMLYLCIHLVASSYFELNSAMSISIVYGIPSEYLPNLLHDLPSDPSMSRYDLKRGEMSWGIPRT